MRKFFEKIRLGGKAFQKHIEIEAEKHSRLRPQATTDQKSIDMKEFAAKIKDVYFRDSNSIICIGCRNTSEVKMFEDVGFFSRGIDVCKGNSKITKAPAEKMDEHFSKDSFDVGYASHSLEHMVYPEKSMKNIRSVCKDGCYVILPLEKKQTEPSRKHPTVFEISLCDSEASSEELKEKIIEDFSEFEPYDIQDVFFHSPEERSGEFHICFKWKEE